MQAPIQNQENQENQHIPQNPEDIHVVNEANVGKCIDFEVMLPGLRREGPAYENKFGWKIIDVVHGQVGNQQWKTYKVKSDYGNGNEEKEVWGFEVKDIYDCPGGAQGMQMNGANDMLEELPGVEGVNRNNENMEGGKRKYKKSRKVRTSKKTRKGRKGKGKSRKH